MLTKSFGLHQHCWFTMQPHLVITSYQHLDDHDEHYTASAGRDDTLLE